MSYGYTFWVNSEHSRLAPALQKVQRKKEIAEAPIRARGEEWALDPEAVKKVRIITACAVMLALGLYVVPAGGAVISTSVGAFFDKLSDVISNILFVPSF